MLCYFKNLLNKIYDTICETDTEEDRELNIEEDDDELTIELDVEKELITIAYSGRYFDITPPDDIEILHMTQYISNRVSNKLVLNHILEKGKNFKYNVPDSTKRFNVTLLYPKLNVDIKYFKFGRRY